MSAEERTYTLTLTESEARWVNIALGNCVRMLYGSLGRGEGWGRAYEAKVRADVDTMWGIVDRLRLPQEDPEDFTVEGEDTPLPDEREAERSEQ